MAKTKNKIKSTKRLLTFLLLIATFAGWGIASTFLLGKSQDELQTEMIQEADALLKDGLYVRAAEGYKSAIDKYKTEKNESLESKLLNIYKEGNLISEYVDLQEERIGKMKATPEEYVLYCSELIEKGQENKAVSILAAGEEQFDHEALTKLYESVKYANRIKDLDSQIIKTRASSWIMPTSDGKKWGYIDSEGRILLENKYEDAVSFAGNYTVVKENDVFIVIDQRGNKIAIDKNGMEEVCSMIGNKIVGQKKGRYYMFNHYFEPIILSGFEKGFEDICLNDNGILMIKNNKKWAIYSSDYEPITDFIFTDIVLNSKGQVFEGNSGVVKDEKGYFIINKEGQAYSDKKFLNMKGNEGGLIAFRDEKGKWGYVSGQGEVIVKPAYEDACSFSYHLGAVKYAGKWGYINRYNTMIIEAEYEEASPFLGGKALVKDSFDTYKVITLKYQDVFN